MPLVSVFLLMVLALFSRPSHSETCALQHAPNDALTKIAEIRDKIEEPPFIVACREPPGLLQGRPKTGLFKRQVTEADSQGLKTRDLLKAVVRSARKRITESKFQIQNISTCMRDASPRCSELKRWVDHDLPQLLSSARYNLSLAQSQHEFHSWTGAANPFINGELGLLGSYKFETWAPLTAAEKKNANENLAAYKTEIRQAGLLQIKEKKICRLCIGKFSSDALLAVRFQHYQTYHQIMSEFPVLQYLSGPLVSAGDLDGAFKKMNEGLKSEDVVLDKYMLMLNSSEPLPSTALEILNYASILEEVLLEDKRFCGLASSLVYTSANRQLGNSIAIGLPVLAVSFLAAPIVVGLGGSALAGTVAGIGTGVVAGGSIAVQSYVDFKETQQRTMGHIYGDELGADLRQLESASSRAKYDAVTLPVGFGLGGLALRSLTIGGKALSTSRKVFSGQPKKN